MSRTNNLYLGLASIMIVIILGSALIAPPAAYATSGSNLPKNGKDNHDKETKDKEVNQKDRKDKDDDKDKGKHNDHDKDCDSKKYDKECKKHDKDKDDDKNKGKKIGDDKDKDFDIPSGNDFEIPRH